MKILISRAFAAALLVTASIVGASSPAPASAQDEPEVPVVSSNGVVNMENTEHPIEALRGRLVLLTFFAPWSDRCVTAVTHLSKLHDKWAGRGLTILSVAEGTVDQIKPFVEEHGVLYPSATLPTLEYERLSNALSVPGLPHAVLISPDGKILLRDHPQALKDHRIKPHVTGIRNPPPVLPDALAAQQKLFEEKRWAEARESLAAARDGLDKIAKVWADGLIAFVDERRATWLTDAARFESDGRYWDAWNMYTEFTTTFVGLEGAEPAAAAAAAIRTNSDAEKDLKAGDDVVTAKERIAAGKDRQAKLILERVIKQAKGSVHAVRAKALLDSLK